MNIKILPAIAAGRTFTASAGSGHRSDFPARSATAEEAVPTVELET